MPNRGISETNGAQHVLSVEIACGEQRSPTETLAVPPVPLILQLRFEDFALPGVGAPPSYTHLL